MSVSKYLLLLALLAAPFLSEAQRRAAPTPTRRAATAPAVHPQASPLVRAKAAPAKAGRILPRPAGVAAPLAPGAPAFTRYLHSPWVDSLMRVLTPDQRAAQLFMVAAWSNRSAASMKTRFRP